MSWNPEYMDLVVLQGEHLAEHFYLVADPLASFNMEVLCQHETPLPLSPCLRASATP
jgi:hypothetical protein